MELRGAGGAIATVLACAALAGCGLGRADMTCTEYRDHGTATDPVDAQARVIDDHVDIGEVDPQTDRSLAHMATLTWCHERDEHGDFVHADREVSEFLRSFEI